MSKICSFKPKKSKRHAKAQNLISQIKEIKKVRQKIK
jgi:hypothetical protein